jgi:hypothetical protein
VVQVVHEDPHDLAEAQRDDGEVVAAQAQRGQAEDDPGQRRKPAPSGSTSQKGRCSSKWGEARKAKV